MTEKIPTKATVRIIASSDNWIEGEATRQLNDTALLEGMKKCVGLPDLHPGKGGPIGAAFLSTGFIYPTLIGNDIGCGIGLWQTTLKKKSIKRDTWAKKLSNLHLPYEGDITPWLERSDLTACGYDKALGTIGSGNHFAELQTIDTIYDHDKLTGLGINVKKLFLLVHSGSRGIGERILRQHTEHHGAGCLTAGSINAERYLKEHDHAMHWAESNRSLIAHRFSTQLGADCNQILDSCHNSIEKVQIHTVHYYLHRKGAAASNRGVFVIPGSRGTLSYIVEPVGEQHENLWSLAHGAGRKWNRSSCKSRLRSRYTGDTLSQTQLGSVVICDDKELLYEEAPQAYKTIGKVIADMKGEGLIRILATLRPVITYKWRKSG